MGDCGFTYVDTYGDDIQIPPVPTVSIPTNPFGNIIVGQTQATMSLVQTYAASAVSAANSAIGALSGVSMPSGEVTPPTLYAGSEPGLDTEIGVFEGTNPTPIPDPFFPFDFNEDYYQSPLEDAVQAKLLRDVLYGGTGLNADIEAEIMARETERDNLLLQEAIDKVSTEWSKRRFALPNGVLAANIRRVYTDWENARLDKSRKIAEDSERIAIENTRWANDSGITLEQGKREYKTNYWRRKLDGEIGVMNAGVAVFDGYVKKFVAHYEGEKAKAQGFAAGAQAQASILGAKAEVFKAKVSLEAAQGDVTVKAYEVNARIAEAISRIAVEAASAAAQAASHIAAGALSAIHASASISENSSHSESASYGISTNFGQSSNYSQSGSINKSFEKRQTANNSVECQDYYYHPD